MAEFVRWGTDCYMEFLASRKLHNAIAVTNGLSKLEDVKCRLLVNTSEVDRFVQLNKFDRDIKVRNARMLGILNLLFDAIIDHHKGVDNSLVGVEEGRRTGLRQPSGQQLHDTPIHVRKQ